MVPVGSRVRGRLTLKDTAPKSGGTQIINEVSIEIEGQERPALIAETITLLFE